MFIVDGHEDIAYNALNHGRDVRLSVVETRESDRSRPSAAPGGPGVMGETAMVGLPEHRRGGVGLVFATIFTMPAEPAAATQAGLEQLFYYHDLARQQSGVRLVTSRPDLESLLRDWQAAPTPDERPIGFVLLMEGADPISRPAELGEWVNGGLRIVGLAWKGTRYSGGTRAPGPLTPLGRSLLAEMEKQDVILDVSHLAEESFWQAMERFSGVVIASHANCREFVPTDRHLTDAMIRTLAEREGVIGTVLANPFLDPTWEPGKRVTLESVVRHIDRIAQLTGSAAHSAIGSDFDGGFGVETTPVEFDSVADLGKIADALSTKGYSSSDIAGIMGENWLRVLRRSLPASASPLA